MSVLYREHFQLSADPFSITPDTAFFFGGGQRADILEALAVSVTHDEGIVIVVGEVGMGKTMLSRMLLDRLRAQGADTVYLPNPVFDRNEILDAIVRDLTGRLPRGSRTQVLAVLEPLLIERYSQGRRVVLVVDEAHAMPPATLEEIRLLSNLETAQHKLLKIVMFGQPELELLLRATHLRQVRDRISHRFLLPPLTRQEIGAYLEFRLQRAGFNRGTLFTAEAQQALAQASGGRTRRVNLLADKSLLAAFAEGSLRVDLRHVRQACADDADVARQPATPAVPAASRQPWLAAGTLGLLGVAFGWWLGRGGLDTPGPSAPSATRSAGAAVAELVREPAAAPASPPATMTEAAAPAPAPAAPVPAAAAGPATPASTQAADRGLSELAVSEASAPGSDPAPAPTPASGEPLADRMARTEAFIAARAGRGFTIQVLALPAPQLAELAQILQRFERLAGAGQPLLVNDRLYGGQPFHAVYLGVFETREQAQSALEALPAGLKEHRPMIRSFARLAQEPRP